MVKSVNQVLSASVIVRPRPVLVDIANPKILEIAALGLAIAPLVDLHRLRHHGTSPISRRASIASLRLALRTTGISLSLPSITIPPFGERLTRRSLFLRGEQQVVARLDLLGHRTAD
jgi:hypothetical protein